MESRQRIAVYLSTCDNYSDCWDPFFQLFEKYWPDFYGTVYMSSEYKRYNRNNVESMCLCAKHSVPVDKRVTWSKLTRWALEDIPSEIILFMQEDFFLKGAVRTELIDKYISLMDSHTDIKCIHMTDQCGSGSFSSDFRNLDTMELRRPYRISCQCALWRKQELLTLLRDRENAWEWETFGSSRSAALGHLYLQVSHDFVKLGQFEIVPYVFTGIIKGKWFKEVPSLFKKNGINIDFSQRGMYSPGPSLPPLSIYDRLNLFFKRALNKLDIETYKMLHRS